MQNGNSPALIRIKAGFAATAATATRSLRLLTERFH
jgi:hypothetical protein